MEPAESAKAASLRHVSDDHPGIRRRRSGKGFSYVTAEGQTVRDKATLARIRALAIPPAWIDVWICPLRNGHLQATGRDARRRKQYRYHPRWRQVRDETKYERMAVFATALPGIRTRVEQDIALPGLPREKVLATIVWLLETTFIRVGNQEYARDNESFGLTTLRNRHVQVEGRKVKFRFRGKSGKPHAIDVHDRYLARLVKHLRELPGQDLFQYVDEAGEPQPINSTDVNEYLGAISEQEFTAKDFRTWGGTLLAARNLGDEFGDTEGAAKTAMVSAVQAVAKELGNTPAICRKCYIHPAILDAFQNHEHFDRWRQATASGKSTSGLTDEENALLRFLEAPST